MPTHTPNPASDHFTLAEEGEALGTVRQFAERLDLSVSQVVPCLQENNASVILRTGRGPEQLLILDSGGVETLRECAS